MWLNQSKCCHLIFQVISKIVKSMWKPWNYLVGTANQEEIKAPSGELGDEEAAAEKAEEESPPSRTASPGAWIIMIYNQYIERPLNLDFTPTVFVLLNQTVKRIKRGDF